MASNANTLCRLVNTNTTGGNASRGHESKILFFFNFVAFLKINVSKAQPQCKNTSLIDSIGLTMCTC